MLNEEVKVGQGIGDADVVPNTRMGALDGLGVLGSGDPAEAVLVAVVACIEAGNAEFFVCVPANAWMARQFLS